MRRFSKFLALPLILTAIFAADRRANAASPVPGTPGSLAATASVIANCQFNTSPTVAFGNYDALSGTANTNSADLSVTCTKAATNYIITMDAGSNGSGSGASVARGMKDTVSGDVLSYNLYSDNGYASVWGTTTATGLSFSAAGLAGNTISVYGKIPSGQDVTVGDYSDTLTVTANF